MRCRGRERQRHCWQQPDPEPRPFWCDLRAADSARTQRPRMESRARQGEVGLREQPVNASPACLRRVSSKPRAPTPRSMRSCSAEAKPRSPVFGCRRASGPRTLAGALDPHKTTRSPEPEPNRPATCHERGPAKNHGAGGSWRPESPRSSGSMGTRRCSRRIGASHQAQHTLIGVLALAACATSGFARDQQGPRRLNERFVTPCPLRSASGKTSTCSGTGFRDLERVDLSPAGTP